MAPRWRLRPGRRAPRRFSGASVRAVSGPVLAGFGRFRRPARPTSTPSGARRGPWAAALPRRGSPGPAGVRRGDLRAAAGAVGRQGAVCPRLAGGGPRGEVPARSTPRQPVEAARRPRAVPGRRSDPPACSRDSVGPAQAPQTRLQMDMAFLEKVIVSGSAARRAPRVVLRPMLITQAGRSFQALRKRFSNTCQTLVHRVHGRAGATQRAQTAAGTRGSSGVRRESMRRITPRVVYRHGCSFLTSAAEGRWTAPPSHIPPKTLVRLLGDVRDICPGRKPPKRAVRRPALPTQKRHAKSIYYGKRQGRLTAGAGPDRC